MSEISSNVMVTQLYCVRNTDHAQYSTEAIYFMLKTTSNYFSNVITKQEKKLLFHRRVKKINIK